MTGKNMIKKNEEGDRNENNIKRNNHVSLYPDGKESTKKEAMESEDDISQSCVRVVSFFFIIISSLCRTTY